ncbi:MAG: hypothetical protein WAU02_00740 [Candidatus Saccharimonadales bacterium]
MAETTQQTEPSPRFYVNKISDNFDELPPTTFATIRKYTEMDMFRDWDEPGVIKYDVYSVQDKYTHEILHLDTAEELQRFVELDVGVREYHRFQSMHEAINDIANGLPASSIVEGIKVAASEALKDKLALIRRIRLGQDKRFTLDEAYIGLRDLNFALSGIASCLALGSSTYTDDYLSHAWRLDGRVPSNGFGTYNATYAVCHDTYIDEGDLDPHNIRGEYDDDGEIHYPGKIEIRVNSSKRIEFVYTPNRESARNHHYSHSVITHSDGRQRVYENWSLSIRIDLDQNSPAGIALDIARSDKTETYSTDGKLIDRKGDLVGGLLAAASESGSHQVRGFTPEMTGDFRNFSERFALQLHLQGQEQKSRLVGNRVLQKIA